MVKPYLKLFVLMANPRHVDRISIDLPILYFKGSQVIRIYHECEGRIRKIHPEDGSLASQGLPNDDK